jgi:hypothetical protein
MSKRTPTLRVFSPDFAPVVGILVLSGDPPKRKYRCEWVVRRAFELTKQTSKAAVARAVLASEQAFEDLDPKVGRAVIYTGSNVHVTFVGESGDLGTVRFGLTSPHLGLQLEAYRRLSCGT